MIMRLIPVVVCCLMLGGMAQTVNAISDAFLINTLVGGDVIAPSIPDNLIVTPVATDQIDVAWDASTDNFSVLGYQVFRDSVQIATTTLTSFSDTGLADDTTFAYTVRAFDAALNLSGFSTSSATTTFAIVSTSTPPVVNGGGASAGSIEPTTTIISNVEVVATETMAIITFTTNLPVRSLFQWGRTSSFETGYAAYDVFKTNHRIVVTDLEPGLAYESKITLLRRLSGTPVERNISFTTQAGADIVAPANVMNFRATYDNDRVQLTWDNPIQSDFDRIRIMSSDRFYPTSVADGNLLYEGAGTQVIDRQPLSNGVRYYTAFTLDAEGNISSGAVDFVRIGSGQDTEVSDIPIIASSTGVAVLPATISNTDILFLQSGEMMPYLDSDVRLVAGEIVQSLDDDIRIIAGEVTKIAIPYDALPEHLKTIVVYIRHPIETEKVFSFLLKVNEDQTAFEALIGGLSLAGEYETRIEVFDFKTKTIARATGTVVVIDTPFRAETQTMMGIAWWRWVLVLVIFILLGRVLWRRYSGR